MKNLITVLILAISINIYSQNINGKLGSSGQFIIRDTANTFLTLHQSTGYLNLNRSLVLPNTTGSTTGVIYKGFDRFIHNYQATGTTGQNVFIGINSGNFTMSGTSLNASNNTGVGNSSLNSLTTGSSNSAFGYSSLYSNTTGKYNSAFGDASLPSNTTGESNSAFGYTSLYYNSVGYNNSAFGTGSLYFNTSGYENSAFGEASLQSNTTGSSNSAFGHFSLYSNTTGNHNSAFGNVSLATNTTGLYNSAFGDNSGINITTGNNNTCIGYNTQVPNGTASNQVRIGNTSVTYAGIQVAWTITSDKNLKSNILNTNLGLGFISKLRPVSYTRKNDESNKTEYGLIAQEVEETLKQEGVENAGMLTVTDKGEYQLRYNDLLAPMIKAIQELKAEKDNEIATLKSENEILKAQLNEIRQTVNELKQNRTDVKEIKTGGK